MSVIVPDPPQTRAAALPLAIATYLDRCMFNDPAPSQTVWDNQIGGLAPTEDGVPRYSGVIEPIRNASEIGLSAKATKRNLEFFIVLAIALNDSVELSSLAADWAIRLDALLISLRTGTLAATGYDISGTYRSFTFQPDEKLAIQGVDAWDIQVNKNQGSGDGQRGGVAFLKRRWRIQFLGL